MSGWQESQQLATCWGIRHTQAYNIVHELLCRGVEVVYCQVASPYLSLEESEQYYGNLDVPPADHALIIEPIAFHHRTFNWHWSECYSGHAYPRKRVGRCPFFEAVRLQVPGCISTIGDSHCNGLGMEDVMFYEVERNPADAVQIPQHSVKLGWAADGNVFQPNQDRRPLRILLDHPHYIEGQPDETDMLVRSLMEVSAKVCRFGPTAEEDIDPANYTPTKRYGSRMPHLKVAAIHGKAHVFCVTHQESQGLSVLEAAMSGSLIVAKKGHIKPALLDGLAHVTYEEQPDWDATLAQVNPARARRLALPYDRWDEVGQIIYDTFDGWSKP